MNCLLLWKHKSNMRCWVDKLQKSFKSLKNLSEKDYCRVIPLTVWDSYEVARHVTALEFTFCPLLCAVPMNCFSSFFFFLGMPTSRR